MPTYDSTSAQLQVYTFKGGALAALGHDLRLVAEAFTVNIDEARSAVSIAVVASSLRVDTAMSGGRTDLYALSARDREKITTTLAREVLEVDRYPVIAFRSVAVDSAADKKVLRGVLELHGVQREIAVSVRAQEN